MAMPTVVARVAVLVVLGTALLNVFGPTVAMASDEIVDLPTALHQLLSPHVNYHQPGARTESIDSNYYHGELYQEVNISGANHSFFVWMGRPGGVHEIHLGSGGERLDVILNPYEHPTITGGNIRGTIEPTVPHAVRWLQQNYRLDHTFSGGVRGIFETVARGRVRHFEVPAWVTAGYRACLGRRHTIPRLFGLPRRPER